MIRESLQAGARHASLLTSVGYGLLFQWRATSNSPNGAMSDVLPRQAVQLPLLLQLTRQGDIIIPTYSLDGGNTFQLAGDPLKFGDAMPGTLFVGLAMTSHNGSETSTAHFDGLEIQKG